jgi:hypothetical protein
MNQPWRAERLPVNLITGMLGAGKTTLIRHFTASADRRWGVLVNEFGDIGLDGDWLRRDGVTVREVAGGCMGCTAAVTLRVTLNRLIREARPEHLLIEPTGLGHPAELLKLLRDPLYEGVLEPGATLCLVDARRLSETRFVASPLWQQQLASADVLVGTKHDLWDAEATHHWQALVAQCGEPAVTITQGMLDPGWLAAPVRTRQVFVPAGKEQWDAHGWTLPDGWRVTEAGLRTWLASFEWERIKGELAGVEVPGWRLDAVADEVTLMPLAACPASRIQVIVRERGHWPAWQAQLLAAGQH